MNRRPLQPSCRQEYNPPMTTINNLDDFLQALDANPSW